MLAACREAMAGAVGDMDFVRPRCGGLCALPPPTVSTTPSWKKTELGAVVSLDCGWSDVGAWSALWEVGERDADDNVLKGDVIADNCSGSYLRSESRLLAATGVEDVVVVETADAVLVASRDKVQDVKNIVNALKSGDRSEASLHRRVYRPWGSYESLVTAERFQVKRITVNPGQQLSLQMHHHRAEHWIVVHGTAEVTCEEKVFMLGRGRVNLHPPGSQTPSRQSRAIFPLELIEVQSGAYLGEDDIVRLRGYLRTQRKSLGDSLHGVSMSITKCLFPVAGYGTRFLPATKSMPKEMLPIVNKPLVQYGVEEAIAAGMTTCAMVTGRGKRAR